MEKITIYCEKTHDNNLTDVSYELIFKALQMKNQAKSFDILRNDFEVEAVIIGSFIAPEAIDKAYSAGANRVVLIKNDSLDEYNHITFANCFVEYLKQKEASVVLFPATVSGRSIAPRVTTILDTGLVADCIELEFILKDSKLKLAATRPTFGAELMATILCKRIPQCATVRPNVFKAEFNNDLKGEFLEYSPTGVKENKIKLVRALLDEESEIKTDFSNAKIILCAGWGLNSADKLEYFSKLEKLAGLIGAKYASTRKVVDFNIASHSSQVGQTGSTVESPLYIGFGVSGAIQHIAGMKNCKTIIGINTDSSAPIFDYCDYKVVKDAKVIIDELLAMFNVG